MADKALTIDTTELLWAENLKGYGDEAVKRVRTILARHNIALNDPVAAIVASIFVANCELFNGTKKLPMEMEKALLSQGRIMNEMTGLLERTHTRLINGTQDLFDAERKSWLKAAEESAQSSIRKYEGRIGKILLIRFTLPVALTGLTIIFFASGLSFLVGSGMKSHFTAKVAERTHQEESLLRWANSKDGQIAHELNRLNEGVFQYCLEEIEQLNGRCLLHTTENPSQTQKPLSKSSSQ